MCLSNVKAEDAGEKMRSPARKNDCLSQTCPPTNSLGQISHSKKELQYDKEVAVGLKYLSVSTE